MGERHYYLVDASVYIFRAFFSLPSSLMDRDGHPVNAVLGFCRFVVELLTKVNPAKIAIAFDVSLTTSFRNDIYPEYKANREEPPEDLIAQLQRCRDFTDLVGVANFASEKYEADDIIGALAEKIHRQKERLVVVTRDKDLTQVLRDGDYYWDYASDLSIPYADIKTHFGVYPEQVSDFLALTGDSVDNIPGVPGIGKKTASVILDKFETIDHARQNPERLRQLPIRGAKSLPQKLESNWHVVELARKLTRIPKQIDMDLPLTALTRAKPDTQRLERFFDRLGMGRQLRRQVEELVL